MKAAIENTSMTVTKYGMYSSEGNMMVGAIVRMAKANNFTWEYTRELLNQLADSQFYAEATDTMVRELAYMAIFEQETFEAASV